MTISAILVLVSKKIGQNTYTFSEQMVRLQSTYVEGFPSSIQIPQENL